MGQGPSQISQYPNGFPNGVTIRGVPITMSNPGNVYWVNSTSVLPVGGVAGVDMPYPTAGTYLRPFATLDYAIGQCTASRGDIIVLMPGYTDTISSATDLVCDVAGVAIVGLGSGSLAPTLTFDTAATATIPVSAANVSFINVRFIANFADIAEVFTPTAVNLTLQDCYFGAAATNMNFLSLADTNTTDGSANGLSFIGCTWIEPDAATLSMVTVDGDMDSLTLDGCYVNIGVNTNDLPIIAAVATGKDLTNVNIQNSRFIRLNDANPLLITADTTTANTGVIAYNTVRHLDTAAELLVTAGTNFSFTQNLCSTAVDTSGFLVPIADS